VYLGILSLFIDFGVIRIWTCWLGGLLHPYLSNKISLPRGSRGSYCETGKKPICCGFSCLFKQAGYAIIYLDRIVDTDIGRILLKGGMPMVYVFVDVSSERSTLVTA